MCVYIYIYTYIHTYIHTYITLHYITLHYITLHYITLHYITLHYIHTCIYIYIYIYIYMALDTNAVGNRDRGGHAVPQAPARAERLFFHIVRYFMILYLLYTVSIVSHVLVYDALFIC